MVKYKISQAGTWEPLLDDIHLSEKSDHVTSISADNCEGFYSDDDELSDLFGSFDDEMPQSEIFNRTRSPLGDSIQAPIEENLENSPTANGIQAYLGYNNESSPSGCGTRDSSEENHRKSPFRNTIHYVDSGDEQNSGDVLYNNQIQDILEKEKDSSQSNSTSLILVNCSVTCVPLYNGQVHVTDRSTRNPQSDAPPVDFATKRLYLTSNQQTYCYHEVPRSVGRSKHQKKKVVSAASLKSIGRFGPYDSPYRGVTRHKWTGKFEAHLWDSSCSAEGRTRKGKQVYLGGYETAEEAARAHDLAALKYWGPSAIAKLNFDISNYENELEEMECITREELKTFLRRQSLSFTRGSSIYRGVTSRNRKGHWQARIKVASSKKDIYLGTFSSEEEAARAYDIAAIRLKGINALTNFDVSDYLQGDLKDLASIPQPKRVKRSGEVSALTTDTVTDSQPDGSISLSDSPLDEIIRRKILARLPDHPTAMLPN